MTDDPTWAELLSAFALMAAVPIVIGGTVILSLVGLTMWVTASLRRRRRGRSDGGQAVSGGAPLSVSSRRVNPPRPGPEPQGDRVERPAVVPPPTAPPRHPVRVRRHSPRS